MSECRWKKRCVVAALRKQFIRPWIRAYLSSGNRTPLVLATQPDGAWSEGDIAYVKAAADYTGGMVLDCSKEWEKNGEVAKRSPRKGVVGCYCKRLILLAVANRLSPKEWAWVDDDIEITAPMDKCFDYCSTKSGFVCTHFYMPSLISKKHPASMYRCNLDPKDKIAWNSFMFFHGDANRQLKKMDRDFEVEDDEIVFTDLYKSDKAWHDGFYDFSSMKWQKICKDMSQVPTCFNGVALHYATTKNNCEVKKYWAGKADKLPPAPFEEMHGIDSSSDAIDAVFVVGNGSKHLNEELRYALRSLDANCKFIRNVYICGTCPAWVDKSQVRFLQWPDSYSDHAKDANIIDKLRHACEQPEIADRVLFCSDDQFVTKECTWDDFRPRYLRRYSSSDRWYVAKRRVWHNRLKATLARDMDRRKKCGLDTKNVYYYQPHIWMPIDRDRFLEYAKWSDYQHRVDTIIASGYFNFVDAGGEPNFDHMFLSSSQKVSRLTTHVAYTDGSFGMAMGYLKKLFPNPSRFEIK
jgi:hypothetical protein